MMLVDWEDRSSDHRFMKDLTHQGDHLFINNFHTSVSLVLVLTSQ